MTQMLMGLFVLGLMARIVVQTAVARREGAVELADLAPARAELAREARSPPLRRPFDGESKCQDMNSLTDGGGANVEHASELNGPEQA
jgi:hypothetical protein